MNYWEADMNDIGTRLDSKRHRSKDRLYLFDLVRILERTVANANEEIARSMERGDQLLVELGEERKKNARYEGIARDLLNKGFGRG